MNLVCQMKRPFLSYYGSKFENAVYYPKPKYDQIIEPFAGSAGYSCIYHQLQIHLYEINPIVYGIWDYLIHVKESEVRSLPLKFESVNDLNICQEAKWLIGFRLASGIDHPYTKPSAWMRGGLRPNGYWSDFVRSVIANQIQYIRHWKISNRSYDKCPSVKCTWFIDPPYQGRAGKHYQFKIENHTEVSKFAKSRNGQVIVCEMSGADWLPFQPFRNIKSTKGRCNEVIWTNDGSHKVGFDLGDL